MTTANQGQRANANGRSAEDVIDDMLRRKGYAPVRQARIGLGIYGRELRTDFYLPSLTAFPNGLCIESKWQEVGGSADEKFPYLVANIRLRFPCPCIVVAGGGGARRDAIAWLKGQVDDKLVGVFGLEELLTWINRNL